MDYFTVDEILNLDLTGYLDEYFHKYKEQNKKIVEDDIIPKPHELDLSLQK